MEFFVALAYGVGFLAILAVIVLIVWALDHYVEMDWY